MSFRNVSFTDTLSHTSILDIILDLCLLIVGGSFFYISARVIYNVYFHPLAKFPGPVAAAATRAWYCWYSLNGRLPFVLCEAHHQYGDVVRIAPDELSYTDPNAWNDIYGHRQGKSEIIKDPLYYANLASGPGSIFRANRVRHGHIRKQMSHGFSEKALRAQEPAIRGMADLFIQRLTEASDAHQAVDMVKWFNFFTFDVMGELVFGESFGCLSDASYHSWVAFIFDAIKFGTFTRIISYFPILRPIKIWILPPNLARRRAANQELSIAKANHRRSIEDGRQDLVSGLLKRDSGISDMEYWGTCGSLIMAGSETTATLMSGAIYYLLKNPDKLAKLRSEIDACLNEALRIYPPVPDAFPRNTMDRPEEICGRLVPLYTTVRMTHWAAYHLERNFVRSDEYIPERWIEGTAGFENDRKAVLQPFHVGPRNCIGRSLAYLEMRLLIAMLLFQFDLHLEPTSGSWIEENKIFLLWEKPKLMVKLTSRTANVAISRKYS